MLAPYLLLNYHFIQGRYMVYVAFYMGLLSYLVIVCLRIWQTFPKFVMLTNHGWVFQLIHSLSVLCIVRFLSRGWGEGGGYFHLNFIFTFAKKLFRTFAHFLQLGWVFSNYWELRVLYMFWIKFLCGIIFLQIFSPRLLLTSFFS